MILCNLAVLLAERKTKISKVSADTGISRTTLTALYYNTGRGVQFDTANSLCLYLDVGMDELFTTLPFDLTVEECSIRKTEPAAIEFDCRLQYKRSVECPTIIATSSENPLFATEMVIDIPSVQPENSVQENALLSMAFSQLNNDAKRLIEGRFCDALLEAIADNIETEFEEECYKCEFIFPERFTDK